MLEHQSPRPLARSVVRTAGGVVLVVVAASIALSILGFAFHLLWTLVKVAVVVGLVLLGLSLLGGRRDH